MQMRETINWFKMICCPIIIYDYFKCSDNENELEFLLLRIRIIILFKQRIYKHDIQKYFHSYLRNTKLLVITDDTFLIPLLHGLA